MQNIPNEFNIPKNCLADQIILVTGAGDGLGAEIAKAAASYGATCILLGRTVSKLERVYDDIEAAGGAQPAIYPINLETAVEKDYDDLAASISDNFGKLHGLVHAAAALRQMTPISHFPDALWQGILNVNLTAPFRITQRCLPLLEAAAPASVIFVGDTHAAGKAYWGAYGASKAGLDALMGTLADEHETAGLIRFNLVDPGPMETQLRALAYPNEDQNVLPKAAENTNIFLHLLNPANNNINGQRFVGKR